MNMKVDRFCYVNIGETRKCFYWNDWMHQLNISFKFRVCVGTGFKCRICRRIFVGQWNENLMNVNAMSKPYMHSNE